MRTTLDLDDDLVREARLRAAEEGRTLTSLIEDGLRSLLAPRRPPTTTHVQLPTFTGDGFVEGVDPADPRALRDAALADDVVVHARP